MSRAKRNLDAQAEAITSEVAAIDRAFAQLEATQSNREGAREVVPTSQVDVREKNDNDTQLPAPKPARPKKPKAESPPKSVATGEKHQDDPTITFSTKLHLTIVRELNKLHHERATLGLYPYRKMDLVEEGLQMVFAKYRKAAGSG